MRALVAALMGTGVGLGVFLLILGIRGSPRAPAAPDARRFPVPEVRLPVSGPVVGGAALAGVVAFLVTGWVAGAVLVVLAAAVLPRSLGARHQRQCDVRHTEAIATWAEMLRDTMAGAAGIEEAIVSTAPVAPAPIRAPVEALVRRLAHEGTGPALREFGETLSDPAADLLVTALTLAAERETRDVGTLLDSLARSARLQATMSLRVEAGRSRTRTAARVVTLFTVGFAGVLGFLNRAYLEPYDDALGQVVLLLVGACFALAIRQLERMSRLDLPERFLTGAGAGAKSA